MSIRAFASNNSPSRAFAGDIPIVITDLSFLLLAAFVVLLVGLSKGGFGGGLGALAVPLLSLLIDPRLAAAILLPILCTMDAASLWRFRGTWDRRNLQTLLPGALLGTLVGALSFKLANAELVRLMVGLLAIYFVCHYLWGKHFLAALPVQSAGPVRGSFWGLVAGYVSYIAHAGGPPVAIYLLPQRLSKTSLVGTTLVFFAIVNGIKLIPYVYLGQITRQSFLVSLLLLPLAPLGVHLGMVLHNRISEAKFYWISYGLLLLAGIKLTLEGALALIRH